MKSSERQAWAKYVAARAGAKKAKRLKQSGSSPAELEAALDDLVAEARSRSERDEKKKG
jgi:hypothetical protein